MWKICEFGLRRYNIYLTNRYFRYPTKFRSAMFFKRGSNATPSDPYTSIPSQRSRRQSAPPQSHLAIAISAPLSASGTTFRGSGSGIAGPSKLPAGVAIGAPGMVRQRSKSVPQLREATSSSVYGYENGVGPTVGKRDSRLQGETSLAGRKTRERHPRDPNNMNVQTETAIPQRNPPSKLPTPTRIPGISSSSSKSKFPGVKDGPMRPSETQRKDNNHTAPTHNTPLHPPSPPSRLRLHTRQKAAAPPVPARPWIRGRGATQEEKKDEQQPGRIVNEKRRVDGAGTEGTADVESEHHRKRNIKRTLRPIPIQKPNPGPLIRELAELLRSERLGFPCNFRAIER